MSEKEVMCMAKKWQENVRKIIYIVMYATYANDTSHARVGKGKKIVQKSDQVSHVYGARWPFHTIIT